MRFRSRHLSGDPRLARSHGGASRPRAHGAATGRYGGGIARAGSVIVAPKPCLIARGPDDHAPERWAGNRRGVNALLTTFTKWPTFVTGLALVRPNPRPVSEAISYRRVDVDSRRLICPRSPRAGPSTGPGTRTKIHRSSSPSRSLS